MRKFISIFIFSFFALVYFISSNYFIVKRITNFRYEFDSFLGSDKYRYGDLFGFSHLRDYKIKIEKKTPPISNCSKPGCINLYMICDSYVWSFAKNDSIFCNVNKFKYVRWLREDHLDEQLDSSKQNILIVEISERFVRKLLIDTVEMYSYLNLYKNKPGLMKVPKIFPTWKKIQFRLHNEFINQNLEFNLFDYIFLSPFRELKAEINFKIFNRTDKDVTVSRDGKYLFYRETTDSMDVASSFCPVTDAEISKIVSILNNEYVYFRSTGFDEVYFSIIPSPVTIVDPGFGTYNNLIKRLENNRELNVPLIKIYEKFRSSKMELFYRSDTHWNYDGFQIWLDETNQILRRYCQE